MKKIIVAAICFNSAFMYANYSRDIQQYLLANYYDFSGDTHKASHLFSLNDSVYTYKGRIHHWHKKGEYKKIIDALPKIEGLFNQDPELHLILVEALQKNGQTQQAYERLIKANNQFPSHAQIAFMTVEELIKQKDLKNALEVINKLLNNAPKKPNFFVFYFLKSQIYTQLQDHKQALENVKISLDMHPHFSKGWLLFALLQEQMGSIKEAIKGYTSYLELTNGSNKEIANHLMQLVIKDKLLQQNRQGFVVNGNCFSQAVNLFKQRQYNRAINQIDQCIMENPQNTQAKLFKIQILTAAQQFNHAASQLRVWIKKESNNELWYKTLHLLVRIGAQPDTIIKTFESIEHDNPENSLTLIYLADLFARTQNQEKAIEYLNKSAAQTTDPTLKTKILFQLGVLYFEQKKYNDMHTVLERAYSLNTSYPPLLNLLAHYYATKGSNLAHAHKLINAALAHDASNIHFIDTQAVIFYKQKQYTKAQELLTEIAHKSDDATILLHLAKTEYMLKNTNRARELLKQAESVVESDYEKRKIELLQKNLMTK